MARQRPTLRLLTRAAEPVPATGPPSRPWLVALVAAGTVLMCTVLLLPGRGAPPPLAPGQTPLADVVAPEDLVVLDEDATEAARAEARAGVPLVFDVRPGEIDRLETKIHDAFALIRQLRFAPRPQTGDAAGAAGAEAGGDPVDELLRTRLGILPPSDLKGVPPERFTRHLEGELVEALRLTLERGVLLDRDDVPGGTEGEILVRTVGEPRETYVKVADVADLATARALVQLMEVGMAGPQTALGDSIGLAIRSFESSQVDDRLRRAHALVALVDAHGPPEAHALAAADRVRHASQRLDG